MMKSSTEPKYNPLIFGKDSTENIVSISVNENGAYIFKSDESYECFDYKPWLLSGNKSDRPNRTETRLKGNQYYKYLYSLDYDSYKEIEDEWFSNIWRPRTLEEGFMLLSGMTYYKGMKVSDVSVLSFDIETTGLNPHAEDACVLMVSNTYRTKYGKIIKKLFSLDEYEGNEAIMLRDWRGWVRDHNPNILIGHNIFDFDLPYLDARMDSFDIGVEGTEAEFAKKASKFRKDGSQSYSYYNFIVPGREVIDTMFLSIKYDIGRQFPSYALKSIEKHLGLVGEDRIIWDFKKDNPRDWKSWSKETWDRFCEYCKDDADSPIAMFDLMIPAFFYTCQVVPKTMQQIINEASGSQLDSMMIRAYLQDGYSQPKTSEKVEYQGAISFGIPGKYKNVFSVDFHALYPSIIKQYELFDREKDPKGYLLELTRYFTSVRVEYKKMYKETGNSMYDGMQLAVKTLANSIYGFCGAGYLLYNAPEVADKVTYYGRKLLNDICIVATGKEIYEWKEQIEE